MLLLKIIQGLSHKLVIEEEAAQFQVELDIWKLFQDVVVQKFAVHAVAVDVL